MPSGILIHRAVWPQYSNVADRQKRQTVAGAQKWLQQNVACSTEDYSNRRENDASPACTAATMKNDPPICQIGLMRMLGLRSLQADLPCN